MPTGENTRRAELAFATLPTKSTPAIAARAWSTGARLRAADPPRRFHDEDYWARPLDGFGDPAGRLAIVGLAPAAHGANRTGRMFTGDRSGDWLYAALHRAGYANQPHLRASRRRPAARDAYVTAVVRCAPPDNKPDAAGARQLPALPGAGAGPARSLQHDRRARQFRLGRRAAGDPALGGEIPRPKPRFGHGAEAEAGRWTVLGCYHPSQQNTFTGRLTEPMLDAVFTRAGELTRSSPGLVVDDVAFARLRDTSSNVCR